MGGVLIGLPAKEAKQAETAICKSIVHDMFRPYPQFHSLENEIQLYIQWEGCEMPDADFEFLAPDAFEWDENKGKTNLDKHGIDFEDAVEVFDGPVLLRRSDRGNEERWVALGSLAGRLVAVIFARRANVIRIISARRARKNEERAYHSAQIGRSPQGQD